MTEAEQKLKDVLLFCYQACMQCDRIVNSDASTISKEFARRKKRSLNHIIEMIEE